MNKRILSPRTAVAGAAGALLLVAALFVPAAAARWADARRLNAAVPRPAVAGVLGEEARKMPLLYALDKSRYIATTGPQGTLQPAAPDALADRAGELLAGLTASGVLSAADGASLAELVSRTPGETALYAGDNGFPSLALKWADVPAADASPFDYTEQLFLGWHGDSGLVTSLWVVRALEQPPADAVEAYIAYLGLDGLGDWVAVGQDSGTSAGRWSAEGRVYVFYAVSRDSMTRFGISAMTAEEVEGYL